MHIAAAAAVLLTSTVCFHCVSCGALLPVTNLSAQDSYAHLSCLQRRCSASPLPADLPLGRYLLQQPALIPPFILFAEAVQCFPLSVSYPNTTHVLSLTPPAEAVQCFPLPADLPLGRYLRINLHGKRQRQLEDMQVGCGLSPATSTPSYWSNGMHAFDCAMLQILTGGVGPVKIPNSPPNSFASCQLAPVQWYHAIQRVEAFGHVLPPSAVVRLRASIARQPPPAAAAGAVPGYIAAEALWLPGAAGQADGDATEGAEQQAAEQQEGQLGVEPPTKEAQPPQQQKQQQPQSADPGGGSDDSA